LAIQIDRVDTTVEIADATPARAPSRGVVPVVPDVRGAVRQVLADEIARFIRSRGLRG
jgi:hypothetical protein